MLEPHRHPTLEFCYFVGGRAEWTVAGRTHRLRAGDLFIARPGEEHSGRPDPEDPNRNFAIGIDPGALVARGAGGMTDAAADVARAVDQLCIEDGRRVLPAGHGAQAVLRRLLDETDALVGATPLRRILALAMCQALLVEFLVHVARCLLDGRESPRDQDQRIDELERWLATRVADPPSVAEMGARVGLAPSQLTVVCRRARGATPLELLTRLRIEAAQRELMRPRASVTAVAHELGFSSSQYFAIVFQRFTGVAPMAWRRRHRLGG